jgi:hypothetical protein
MGRPLKIQKTNNGVLTDAAYPPFSALTNPVPPTGTNPEWLGVVGGNFTTSSPSAQYPVVQCQVNIALPSGSGQGVANGRIIRQKGARKFLVASATTVNDEDMVVGASYQILSLGGTNWQQMGAPAGATAGAIFTCTATVATASTGTGLLVGQCVLVDDITPAAGDMAISYTLGDSTATTISKITNRFIQNFAGGCTGGDASTGDVWNPAQVVNNVVLDANFFTDEGTEVKSGAETDTWGVNGSEQNAGGTLDVAIVENDIS